MDTSEVRLVVRQPGYPASRSPCRHGWWSTTAPRARGSTSSWRRARDLPTARTTRRGSGQGPLRLPRPGAGSRARTGPHGSSTGSVTSRHLGTDFAGAVGAPVRAAGRAVVALVADFYLAGHAVYLDHGGGLVTGYFHLSRVDVTAATRSRRAA